MPGSSTVRARRVCRTQVSARRAVLVVGALMLAMPFVRTLPARAAGLPTARRGWADESSFGVARASLGGTGVARVIVELAVPTLPEGVLSTPARDEQRRAVATAQDQLAVSGVALSRRYTTLPAVAATVDAHGLAALEALSAVRSVQIDRTNTVADSYSVPLIGGTAVHGHGFRGSGEAVAVLDTGVQANHPYLGGRVITEACFSGGNGAATTTCPNGLSSQSGLGAAAPCAIAGCEHGTHVAGIAAGDGLNLGGIGYEGVAPAASIIAIQVFSDVNGAPVAFDSDVIAGLDYLNTLTATTAIAAATTPRRAMRPSRFTRPRSPRCAPRVSPRWSRPAMAGIPTASAPRRACPTRSPWVPPTALTTS